MPQLVAKGTTELNRILKHNKDCKNGKRQFIIPVSAQENYLADNPLNGYESFLSSNSVLSSLNTRLNSIYEKEHLELYLILLHAFDLKVYAPLPENSSLEKLFGPDKFFLENSNSDSLRQLHRFISDAILANSQAGLNDRNCIVISIGAYKTVFYGDKGVDLFLWVPYKVKRNNTGELDCIYDLLKQSLKNHPGFTTPANRDSLPSISITSFSSACRKTLLRKKILSTYSVDSLRPILQSFNTAADFQVLTVQERLHALSLLVGETMSGNYGMNLGEEGYALRLIKYTPSQQVAQFFSGLENPSVLNGNPNYHGEQGDSDPLGKRLFSRTDDSWLFGAGGNNYAALVKTLSALLRSRPDFEILKTNLVKEESIPKSVFTWDPSYLTTQAPVGHVKYDIGWTGGLIRVVRKHLTGYIAVQSGNMFTPYTNTGEYSSEDPFFLKPFDPILFVNHCHLPMISSGGAGQGEVVVVPAIFLIYAHDKQFNDDALTAGGIAGDFITLAAAPLAFAKAISWSGRAWAAWETANALGNISLNSLGENLPPEFQDLLTYSNTLMLIAGGTKIIKGGYSGFNDALNGVKNETASLTKIQLDELGKRMYQRLPGGKTRYEELLLKAGQGNTSALAEIRFYEKVKEEYRNVFGKDLEEGVFSGSSPPFQINTLQDFLNKIPDAYRPTIVNAFTNGTMELKVLEEDIVFIRHISANGPLKSYWFAEEILNPSDAKKYLALPLSNSAEMVVEVKLKKGTPYIKGIVASQVGNNGFGNYATGGGSQIYVLKEFWQNNDFCTVINGPIPNPKQ